MKIDELTIKSNGSETYVFINGKEINNVTSIKFYHEASERAELDIQINITGSTFNKKENTTTENRSDIKGDMDGKVTLTVSVENINSESDKIEKLVSKLKEANSLANELATSLDIKINELFEVDVQS